MSTVKRGLEFDHASFINRDRSAVRMRVTRVTAYSVYYTCAETGRGKWVMGRPQFEERYGAVSHV